MSAAGLLRVKVVQRKVVQRAGGEIAVVDHDHQRKVVDRIVAAVSLTKPLDRPIRGRGVAVRRPEAHRPTVHDVQRPTARRPCTAAFDHRMPGSTTRGSGSPLLGQHEPAVDGHGSVRSGGPAAAITTFEPSLSRPPL